MNNRKLVFGTRGSRLALWQAGFVIERAGVPSEIRIIKTTGDRFCDIPLQGSDRTGFFTKEIERLLMLERIDYAVHSLKDMPTELPEGLMIAAYLERGPVSDILLVHPDWFDASNPVPVRKGCVAGAGSLRRSALMRRFAPQAEPALVRGNVPTRIGKVIDGQYGALVIAGAGVDRIHADTGPLIRCTLDPEIWIPAPGQGIVAVESRKSDDRPFPVRLDDESTRKAAVIERGVLSAFEGGCHTAFGAYAKPAGSRWDLWIGMEQPRKGWVQARFTGSFEDCIRIGPGNCPEFEVPGQEDAARVCISDCTTSD